VLDGATFTVPAGAVTAVIGPNGSGKSTLLYLLAGLLDPVTAESAGDTHPVVEVLGAAPGSRRDQVALVLQTTEVAEHLPWTVQEAVAMGRYAHRGMFALPRRRDRRENRVAVTAAMERMEVADLANRQLDELSGGQRQRVFVAQGLAQQADLLLLDEPAAGFLRLAGSSVSWATGERRCVRAAG
jgi:manganese transport system ATP-binding protein